MLIVISFLILGTNNTICEFVFLNSGEIIDSASLVVTAKETKVGGTLICSNVPLIESLPPIAASLNSSCTVYAPNNAANVLPHAPIFLFSLSKYS
jgi:hypothetical protein